MDTILPTTLVPLLPIVAAVVAALLDAAWRRHRSDARWLVVAGLVAAFVLLVRTPSSTGSDGAALQLDELRRVVLESIFVGGLVVQAFMPFSQRRALRSRSTPELSLLLGVLGASVIVTATHFAALFLGLELLGLSTVGLVVSTAPEARSIEAGIKYLLLSGASSATLVFGLGLVYLGTGSLEVSSLAKLHGNIALAGQGLVLVGIAFKAGAVPFHWWVADVYSGAPTPATTFLATIEKAAVFGFAVAVFRGPSASADGGALMSVVAVLAVASMLVGNFLALYQDDLVRLIAYSSIAHAGYLLVGVVADSPVTQDAVSFYLVTYIASVALVLGTVKLVGSSRIEDLQGLALARPIVGGSLVLGMLSLAGIPPVAGFVAKLRIVAAGVAAGEWVLAAAIVLTSIVGLVYYLRVVLVVFAPRSGLERGPTSIAATIVALLALLVLGFGLWPSALLGLLG